MSTIVVGVDGSEESVEALRFALGEAARCHAALKAVTAWHVPPAAYGMGWSVPVDSESFEAVARKRLEHTLDDAGVSTAGIEVDAEVVEGEAAEVLCDAARDAELLVVGSRGFGALRTLVTGSVGQACMHHAPCPVVIVPHRTGHH
jgi:nucleotide-binding universal stress UspA family protein